MQKINELEGELEIVVKSGRNFTKKDIFGKLRTYLVFQLDHIKKKTKVCSNGGKNPVWNQSLFVDLVAGRKLIQVKCFKKGMKDELIGQAEINIENIFAKSVEHEDWYPLSHPYKSKQIGDVNIVLMFHAFNASKDNTVGSYEAFKKLAGQSAKDDEDEDVTEEFEIINTQDYSKSQDSPNLVSPYSRLSTKETTNPFTKLEVSSAFSKISTNEAKTPDIQPGFVSDSIREGYHDPAANEPNHRRRSSRKSLPSPPARNQDYEFFEEPVVHKVSVTTKSSVVPFQYSIVGKTGFEEDSPEMERRSYSPASLKALPNQTKEHKSSTSSNQLDTKVRRSSRALPPTPTKSPRSPTGSPSLSKPKILYKNSTSELPPQISSDQRHSRK